MAGATLLDIVVVGTPRPQPRARVYRNGGVVSDSKASKIWKGLVKAAARAAAPVQIAAGLAIELELTIAMPVIDRRRHGKPHTGRKDCDNLAKAILDALQDAKVFNDDGQVSDAIIRKRYPPHPGGARIVLRLVE